MLVKETSSLKLDDQGEEVSRLRGRRLHKVVHARLEWSVASVRIRYAGRFGSGSRAPVSRWLREGGSSGNAGLWEHASACHLELIVPEVKRRGVAAGDQSILQSFPVPICLIKTISSDHACVSLVDLLNHQLSCMLREVVIKRQRESNVDELLLNGGVRVAALSKRLSWSHHGEGVVWLRSWLEVARVATHGNCVEGATETLIVAWSDRLCDHFINLVSDFLRAFTEKTRDVDVSRAVFQANHLILELVYSQTCAENLQKVTDLDGGVDNDAC